ncbi:MAG: hypothetical protein WBY88_10015 [Desulfosarcina sp.]
MSRTNRRLIQDPHRPPGIDFPPGMQYITVSTVSNKPFNRVEPSHATILNAI